MDQQEAKRELAQAKEELLEDKVCGFRCSPRRYQPGMKINTCRNSSTASGNLHRESESRPN